MAGAPDERCASERAPSRSWLAFERALAHALAVLEDEQFLVVERKRSNVLVQFAAQGAGGLRVEAAPNESLPGDENLGRRELRLLRKLGWRRPTRKAGAARAVEVSPDGPPNFFRNYQHPAPLAAIAALAIETLREVYSVAHTGELVYRAFDANGPDILLPTLRLNRSRHSSGPAANEVVARRLRNQAELQAAVLKTLTESIELPDLAFDENGSHSLSYEDLPVFLRVGAEAPIVSLAAPMLQRVKPTSELFAALNHLNSTRAFLNFAHLNESVVVGIDIDCNPFVGDVLLRAMALVGKVAVEVGQDLMARFGGELLVGESGDGTAKGRGRETVVN